MVITTHSPAFIDPEQPETVRLCKIDRLISATRVAQTSVSEIAELHSGESTSSSEDPSGARARIFSTLQSSISEMFFAQRVVLVEGPEDNAYIESYMNLLDLKDEFRRLGCHIIPCNGKGGILRPLAVCRKLDIDVFVVFDTDADKGERNGSRVRDERENSTILRLCEHDPIDPFPDTTIWGEYVVAWQSNIGKVTRAEIGESQWDEIKLDCARMLGPASELKKNPLFISEVVTRAWEKDLKSPSLEKLCKRIVFPAARESES